MPLWCSRHGRMATMITMIAMTTVIDHRPANWISQFHRGFTSERDRSLVVPGLKRRQSSELKFRLALVMHNLITPRCLIFSPFVCCGWIEIYSLCTGQAFSYRAHCQNDNRKNWLLASRNAFASMCQLLTTPMSSQVPDECFLIRFHVSRGWVPTLLLPWRACAKT